MKSSKSVVVALVFIISSVIIIACGSDAEKKEEKSADVPESTKNQTEVHGTEVKPEDIALTTPLNQEWVKAGKATYNLKCQSCHKLTDERLAGAGWAGVTKKREPHWIMNMITNVEMMLDTDPEAQNLLEECLVRKPNQNLSKEQAREILEFMRSNDGVK